MLIYPNLRFQIKQSVETIKSLEFPTTLNNLFQMHILQLSLCKKIILIMLKTTKILELILNLKKFCKLKLLKSLFILLSDLTVMSKFKAHKRILLRHQFHKEFKVLLGQQINHSLKKEKVKIKQRFKQTILVIVKKIFLLIEEKIQQILS